MKSQEHIDDLIKVILTAEEKESVSQPNGWRGIGISQ